MPRLSFDTWNKKSRQLCGNSRSHSMRNLQLHSKSYEIREPKKKLQVGLNLKEIFHCFGLLLMFHIVSQFHHLTSTMAWSPPTMSSQKLGSVFQRQHGEFAEMVSPLRSIEIIGSFSDTFGICRYHWSHDELSYSISDYIR